MLWEDGRASCSSCEPPSSRDPMLKITVLVPPPFSWRTLVRGRELWRTSAACPDSRTQGRVGRQRSGVCGSLGVCDQFYLCTLVLKNRTSVHRWVVGVTNEPGRPDHAGPESRPGRVSAARISRPCAGDAGAPWFARGRSRIPVFLNRPRCQWRRRPRTPSGQQPHLAPHPGGCSVQTRGVALQAPG